MPTTTFDESVDKLPPAQALWAQMIADQAGTTDGDWVIFETASRLLLQLNSRRLAERTGSITDRDRRKAKDIIPRLQAIWDTQHEADLSDKATEKNLDALSDAAVLLDKFCRICGIDHDWGQR